MRILVVEDDEYIAKTLENILGNQRYIVDVANDGLIGWELVEAFSYDLILLDVVLPKLDGIKLCQKLRSHNYQIPVLLLTAQSSNTHKVMGLDAGADDYLVKPFEMTELLARIRVLLRRRNTPIQMVFEWDNLRLNTASCEVFYNGKVLNLTPKEYLLLELFVRNQNQVYSRGEILEHLWSTEEVPQEDTVTAHVKGLRQKLKQAGAPNDFIETVYGLGYRLKLSVSPSQSQQTKHRNKLEVVSNKQDAKSTTFEETQQLLDTRAALTSVWEKLKHNSSDRVRILEGATTALLEYRMTEELRQKARHAAHKLSGCLGVFGFATGSRMAFEIEQILQSEMDINESQAVRLQDLVTALRGEIQQPAFAEMDKVLCNYVLDDAVL